MKISEAKNIPVELLAETLGGKYHKTDYKGDKWFFSPFRPDERTPSFKIDCKKNRWHDFGLANTNVHRSQGSGGDIFDLWCDYHFKDRRLNFNEALQAVLSLKSHSVREAIRLNPRKEETKAAIEQPRYRILKTSDHFTHYGLLNEIGRRRVSRELASLYLKQGYIEDTVTNRKYWGFLFENDKGGFELSIPNPKSGQTFKSCLGVKASSRILVGDDVNSADIFEGFWDFLTWLQLKGRLRPINHSYILNSTSLTGEVCEKIIAFKDVINYAFLFMDNDDAGYQATHAIATELEEQDIKVGGMEYFYNGYKDLSNFRMKLPL